MSGYREMLHLIENGPDAEVARRNEWIYGNAAGHYAEHLAMIERWVKEQADKTD